MSNGCGLHMLASMPPFILKKVELSKTQNPCTAGKSCGECIKSPYECAWCQIEEYGLDGKSRCDFSRNLTERGCEISKIIDPSNYIHIIINKPLGHYGTMENFVQIAPQALKIGMRPKTQLTFKVKFRRVKDYPMDLYYLMDLSNPVEDYKKHLARLGDLLRESTINITSDFRVGFGSFVDRAVMPNASVAPVKWGNSYKNHVSLTRDIYRFADEIKKTLVSRNSDAPEGGGSDAILQAIACRDEIGWRYKARKLLIFLTDSFHFGRDGNRGGIAKPNDGECHLDRNGDYTRSTVQDYPSVNQIIRKVRENSVNIIFATTGEQWTAYQKFSKILEGSAVCQLTNDSSNIVELIKDNYNKITSKVELLDNALPNITISYESSCLETKSRKTKLCEGLKVGDTVTFDVTINMESCLKDNVFHLKINPVGMNEVINIKLESICHCAIFP
ncbi:unnamed protein product [Gordionus sp. m RMFG-2023]